MAGAGTPPASADPATASPAAAKTATAKKGKGHKRPREAGTADKGDAGPTSQSAESTLATVTATVSLATVTATVSPDAVAVAVAALAAFRAHPDIVDIVPPTLDTSASASTNLAVRANPATACRLAAAATEVAAACRQRDAAAAEPPAKKKRKRGRPDPFKHPGSTCKIEVADCSGPLPWAVARFKSVKALFAAKGWDLGDPAFVERCSAAVKAGGPVLFEGMAITVTKTEVKPKDAKSGPRDSVSAASAGLKPEDTEDTATTVASASASASASISPAVSSAPISARPESAVVEGVPSSGATGPGNGRDAASPPPPPPPSTFAPPEQQSPHPNTPAGSGSVLLTPAQPPAKKTQKRARPDPFKHPGSTCKVEVSTGASTPGSDAVPWTVERFKSVKALFAAKGWDLGDPALVERFSAAVKAGGPFEGMAITVTKTEVKPKLKPKPKPQHIPAPTGRSPPNPLAAGTLVTLRPKQAQTGQRRGAPSSAPVRPTSPGERLLGRTTVSPSPSPSSAPTSTPATGISVGTSPTEMPAPAPASSLQPPSVVDPGELASGASRSAMPPGLTPAESGASVPPKKKKSTSYKRDPIKYPGSTCKIEVATSGPGPLQWAVERFKSVKALFAAKGWDLGDPAFVERFSAAIKAGYPFEGVGITVTKLEVKSKAEPTQTLPSPSIGAMADHPSPVLAGRGRPSQSQPRKRKRDPIKHPGSICQVNVNTPAYMMDDEESFTSVKALFAAKAWDLNDAALMERFAAAVAAGSEFEGLVIAVKSVELKSVEPRPAVQQKLAVQQRPAPTGPAGAATTDAGADPVSSSAVGSLVLVAGQPSSPPKKKPKLTAYKRDPIKYPGSTCKIEVRVPGTAVREHYSTVKSLFAARAWNLDDAAFVERFRAANTAGTEFEGLVVKVAKLEIVPKVAAERGGPDPLQHPETYCRVAVSVPDSEKKQFFSTVHELFTARGWRLADPDFYGRFVSAVKARAAFEGLTVVVTKKSKKSQRDPIRHPNAKCEIDVTTLDGLDDAEHFSSVKALFAAKSWDLGDVAFVERFREATRANARPVGDGDGVGSVFEGLVVKITKLDVVPKDAGGKVTKGRKKRRDPIKHPGSTCKVEVTGGVAGAEVERYSSINDLFEVKDWDIEDTALYARFTEAMGERDDAGPRRCTFQGVTVTVTRLEVLTVPKLDQRLYGPVPAAAVAAQAGDTILRWAMKMVVCPEANAGRALTASQIWMMWYS